MKNKTALISGGTQGIGRQTVLELLEAGYNVCTFDVQEAALAGLRKAFKMKFGSKRFLALTGDVSKDASVKKVVQAARKKFGAIDVLVNNAGIGYFEDAVAMDMQKFEKMMQVNVVGVARLTKAVLPLFKKQRHGLVVNMASVAGIVGFAGRTSLAKGEFYSATKAAVLSYSEGLRAEVRPFGIRVASVCAGNVRTPFFSPAERRRRMKEIWHGKEPAMLTPADISAAIHFICDQSAHCCVEQIILMPV